MTSRDTSAKYISRCNYQCSIQDTGFDLRPVPPAMATLTIVIFLRLLHNYVVFQGCDFRKWENPQLWNAHFEEIGDLTSAHVYIYMI
jgi:hypothetical protein